MPFYEQESVQKPKPLSEACHLRLQGRFQPRKSCDRLKPVPALPRNRRKMPEPNSENGGKPGHFAINPTPVG